MNHHVLEVFRKDPTQAMNYKQVAKRLNVKQTSKRKLINKILYELTDKGHLIEDRPGNFKLEASSANLQVLIGKVDMTQTGSAYITVEGFPDDVFVSGTHCRLKYRDRVCLVEDLGSTNGTYIKRTGRFRLKSQDFILLGQQLFRVELKV